MKNSTPIFTILEGFCSLLFLQTAGRLSSWLIRTKSDSWIIVQLLASSCVFSTSMYFLYRIYTFPVSISLASATLIGVVLALTILVALYGIISGRGNSIESSLLVAYIVYCLYFTFTDFQSSISASTFLYFFSSSSRTDIPPLPPVFINGFTNLVSSLAALVPAGFETVFQFMRGAVSTVTPSVFVSLSYRLGVFFAATRIVPAIHEATHSRTNSSISLSDSNSFSPISDEKFTHVALDEDDEDSFFIEDYEEDDDITVIQYDEFNAHLLHEKLEYLTPTNSSDTLTSPPPPFRREKSKINTIQFLIFAYAPCILIAVYTHLLIQHLSLFNDSNVVSNNAAGNSTSGSFLSYLSDCVGSGHKATVSYPSPSHIAVWSWSNGWASPRNSWQFWGWVNMFSTLTLYTLEFFLDKKSNREEIIHHWSTEKTILL